MEVSSGPCLGAASPTPGGSHLSCSPCSQLCPAPFAHWEHSLCSVWGGMQGTCQESCTALSTQGRLSSACAASPKAGSRVARLCQCCVPPAGEPAACTWAPHLLFWWEQHWAGGHCHGAVCPGHHCCMAPPAAISAIASPCPLYLLPGLLHFPARSSSLV